MASGEHRNKDQALDARIHDAFDALGPSASTKERIWERIAAYQSGGVAAPSGGQAESSAPGEALRNAEVEKAGAVASGAGVAAAAVASAGALSDEEAFGIAAFRDTGSDARPLAQLPIDEAVITSLESEDIAEAPASSSKGGAPGTETLASAGAQATSPSGQAPATQADEPAKAAQAGSPEQPEAAQAGGPDGSGQAKGAQHPSGKAERNGKLISMADVLMIEQMPEDEKPSGSDGAAAPAAASTEEAPAAAKRKVAPWKVALPVAAAVAALGIGVFALQPSLLSSGVFGAMDDSAAEDAYELSSDADGSAVSGSGDASSSSSSSRIGTGLTTYDANAGSSQRETAAAVDSTQFSNRGSSAASGETATIIVGNNSSSSSSSSSSGSNSGTTAQPIEQDTVVEAPEQERAAEEPAQAEPEPVQTETVTETVVEPAPANSGGGASNDSGGGTITTTETIVEDTSHSTWARDYPTIVLPDGSELAIDGGRADNPLWELGALMPDVVNGTARSSDGSKSTTVVVYQDFNDFTIYYIAYTSDTGFFVAHPR